MRLELISYLLCAFLPLNISAVDSVYHFVFNMVNDTMLKFVFSKAATKIDKIFIVDLTLPTYVKSTVKILSIFVTFLENMNFKVNNTLNT